MKLRQKKGFSLIEIGIVMVVIGLIIAAVMKGKDVIKSAETKNLTQTFMNNWVKASTIHYDRLGYNVGGEPTAPAMLDAVTACSATTDAPPVITPGDWTDAGIQIASLIKTNTADACSARFQSETLGETTVTVSFQSEVVTSDGIEATRNLVEFNNVPEDVAIAFDKLIDGTVGNALGKIIYPATASSGVVVVRVILEH